MTTQRISAGQVMMIHSAVIESSGGREGVRDMGLIESAVNAPFQSFGGYEACAGIFEKAARLGYGLARNHAFIDGNKRIAALSALVFLRINGVDIECTNLELFTMFYGLAASEITFDDLVEWLKHHESHKE